MYVFYYKIEIIINIIYFVNVVNYTKIHSKPMVIIAMGGIF